MAFFKEEIVELSVLAQKWEKEYVDFLTQMAIDFQEKSSAFQQRLDRMIVDYEDAQIKDIKKLEKKLEESRQTILCCMEKLRQKKGLKKNREALLKMIREMK